MTSEAHTENSPLLRLFVHQYKVGLYPQPPEWITNDEMANTAMTIENPEAPAPNETEMTACGPTTTSHPIFTCLLSAALGDFLPYVGQQQSKWLLDIAHDICDPRQKRGSLVVWDGTGAVWRTVHPVDPLIPSMYIYEVQGNFSLSISKISQRRGKSRTLATGNASTMARNVSQRDDSGKCWVTRSDYSTVNSHVCPKRMGDHVLRVLYSKFISSPAPPALSIYDEICGISLNRNLDAAFVKYELGLQYVAPVRNSFISYPP